MELIRLKWRSYLPIFLVVGLLGACGGGGGGGPDAKDAAEDLILVEFSLVDEAGNPTGASGTTNAYRNNRILLTFSEDLDASTVDDRTIQIGIPSSTNLFLTANGRFSVDGNKVLFDPTVTSTGSENPFGLEADSDYTVIVKGLPDPKTILSVADGNVREPFTTTFRTTDKYLPDLDQPRATEIDPPALDGNDIAELAQMTPEDRVQDNLASRQLDGNGDPIPGTGKWEQIWVGSRDDIFVEFSEAMNPATFDPATTFRVVNLDRNSRDVLGVFLYSADATGVTYRPTFGFGRGPYLIQVTMTVGITDLAENPIGNPQQWTFLTEFDPTAVNEGLFEEYFDWSHADDVQAALNDPGWVDQSQEDWQFSPPGAEGLAAWNPPSDPGKLASTFGVSTTSVPNPISAAVSTNVIPLGTGTFANMFNMTWYKSSDCGNAGTITGFKFISGSSSNAPGAVMTGLTMKIGHNNRTGGLTTASPRTANFNVGSPVTVINNVTYTLPSSVPNVSPITFPAFTKSFGYNGKDHLTVDISKTNTTGQQGWGVRSGYGSEVHRVWGYPSTGTTSSGSTTSYYYQCVLDFRTDASMAQSLWYTAESNDPTYLDAIVAPTEQPPGTETVLEFQGAHDDGTGVPDGNTETEWTQDITDLDGHQHVRFRVRFTANLSTGVGPKLEEIVIPYIFF